MGDLALVVPTRGRPENARRLSEAFWRYTTDVDKWLLFVVDQNDPVLPEYRRAVPGDDIWAAPRGGRPGIVDPLNWAVMQLVNEWDRIGFMGDDHLPRGDWDERVDAALTELGTGIVYGNDLLQGELLPTAAFVTSDIIHTLGYIAPPQLNHLFVDNYWLELGRGIDRIKYLDDVIIEHIHPLNGKAEWDATYSHCNDNAAPKDGLIWQALQRGGYIDRDIEKIKAIL